MKQRILSLIRGKNIRETLFNLLFLLFLSALVFKLIRQFFLHYGIDSWHISELLINYQGGFVRRGLLGEGLLLFHRYTHINIEWVIKIVCLVLFLLVGNFFIRAFLKKGYSLYILPLCFFLGMGVVSDNWIRKDYLMIYFLILILKAYQAQWALVYKLLVINVLFVFILLNHEVAAFFSLPVMWLLLVADLKKKGLVRSFFLATLALMPEIICFLLALRFHGDQQTAQAIWDSVQAMGNSEGPKLITPDTYNAVAALAWDSNNTFVAHFKMNYFTIHTDMLSFFVWCITFPVVYFLATNALMVFGKVPGSFTERHRTILSSILLFQLFCLIPMFTILSCDFVRIFFYWISSSFAIFLIIPHTQVEALLPTAYVQKVNALNRKLSAVLVPTKTTLAFLMLFTGISSYQFMVELLIKNSMLYNILYIVSKPFELASRFL